MGRYIDKDAFDVIGYTVPEEYDIDSFNAGAAYIVDLIDSQPIADVEERKTGHWIWQEDRREVTGNDWYCSECGNAVRYQDHYCSNCGSYNGDGA